MGVRIDIWSDIACPWCFIGKRRFEKALAAFPHRDEVEVTWHSYQLDPHLPEHYDGTWAQYLALRKGSTVERVQEAQHQLTEHATGEGLHYDFNALKVANTKRAHQLIHLAAEHGGADAVEEALFSAHFERGIDVGDTEELVRIGTAAGVPEDEIRAELATGSRVPAVKADIERAAALGIQAVPTFVVEMKYALSGAQPPEAITQALNQVWEETHPALSVLAEGATCGPDGCHI